MWVRRIFYDLTTGAVLRMWAAQGDIRVLAQAEEAEVCGLTGCACLEWTEPDPEVEAAFAPVDAEGKARSVSVTVNVSGAKPQLVFAYEPMPEPEPGEKADMAAALALLGVTPEEGWHGF